MSVEILFKYGSLSDYSESLFATPTVWFATPSSLNDPFECRPWFTFNGSRAQVVDVLARFLQRAKPHMAPYDATGLAVSIYLQGRHRDPETWENLRCDVMARLRNDIGMYCLSKTNTNILMWSHYGRNHEGYCLEFEATDFTPVFGEAQPVLYADEFPVVDFFNTPHDKQVDLIFLTKFIGWRYEEEYRVIDHQAGAGLHSYPPELLRSVTFGLRMPESARKQIRAWVSRRGHGVRFYEASIDDREFKIVVTEAT
jgi:hypothetical protein